ncbi:MAG: hypothetical protein U0Q22_17475 [Acidimicrobiales bacterium]
MASSRPDEHRLFELDSGARPVVANDPPPPGRVVRVVCDVTSIHREFDYVVPDRLIARSGLDLAPGLMVRVPLHGRQVAAWVVDVDVDPPPGVELRSVSKISGLGPPADVVELCRWATWRWAGRLPTFLGAASPPTMVTALPRPGTVTGPDETGRVGRRVRSLFEQPVSVFRLPPAASPLEVIRAAAERGHVLVVCPTFAQARSVADGMRRWGVKVAVHPEGWARATAGCSLVGTRTAVFAPMAELGAIVVLDEHDETLQNEGSPTWHAREVAIERGRRARVPVVLVSPTPSLEALAVVDDRPVTIDRNRERSGWARLVVIDRREDDIVRSGLYSDALVRALRSDQRVVCVLNRVGRAQMLACLRCGTLATCERCEASVRQDDEHAMSCPRCGTTRPVICGHCSAMVFRQIRIGVTKAREQLETLLREPVHEIAGPRSKSASAPTARVVVGTEAALQRVTGAGVVAFLEFDQELGAPRYRAAEQALTLLARASRLVGGREGSVLVQTRQPEHEVIRAALLGDPSGVSAAELERRTLLQLPPVATAAAIGGEAAPAFVDALRTLLVDRDPAAAVDQRDEAHWLVRSPNQAALLDSLNKVVRPPGRLRLQVDPARLPV